LLKKKKFFYHPFIFLHVGNIKFFLLIQLTTHPSPCNNRRTVYTMFGNAAVAVFLKILIFFIKIEYDWYVLDRFDVLMSKIIFKK